MRVDAQGGSWFDIGANLTNHQFHSDLQAVLDRATEARVERIVATGTDVEGSLRALELARVHEHVWCTAGVHPHHATDYDERAEARIEECAADPRVVAIGECGLDFFRNFSPREGQLRAFERQLALAVRTGLPLFLHQRDAHAEFLPRLREVWPDLRGGAVVHCFTEGPAVAEEYLALGCHLGITGWVADERRGGDLREAVPLVPGERLMLETDAPYLLPRNVRPRPATRRNEPMHMGWVGRSVAELRGEEVAVTAARAWRTSCAFFGLQE